MQDITLYMWTTPNSRRASIMLEELGLTFEVQPVNIRAGEQHDPKIVALNPFAKLPILTWHEEGERRVLFESGAILISIAERNGQLLPSERDDRETTMSWLMVALTSVGPLTGMAHHWSTLAAEKSEAALKHHVSLVDRVYRLLDGRLRQRQYLADEYSIADIAAYPWIAVSDWTTLNLADYPNLERWYEKVGGRPAVARGMELPAIE
jgi:GST-like protein